MKIIFSLYDVKTMQFGTPFFDLTPGVACRSIGDEMKRNADSPLAQHPGDFHLYRLGSFIEDTGQIDPVIPEKLVELQTLVEV